LIAQLNCGANCSTAPAPHVSLNIRLQKCDIGMMIFNKKLPKATGCMQAIKKKTERGKVIS